MRGALGLRQVHRDVRALQQRLEVGAVLGEHGDPDARLEVDLGVADREGLGQRGADALGDLVGGAGVAHDRQQHGELVAAEPRHHVARAQRPLEALARAAAPGRRRRGRGCR